jgi:hypothetical protein
MRILTVTLAVCIEASLSALLYTTAVPTSTFAAQAATPTRQPRTPPAPSQASPDLTARADAIEQNLTRIANSLSGPPARPRADLTDLLISAGGTVIGGVLLAPLFFFVREFVVPLPALSGCWTFETETESTSYNPYKGMKLTYRVMVWQEGCVICGSAEKVAETAQGVTRTYTGKYRPRADVRGYLTKRYLGKSSVVLHFKEQGEIRESSAVQTLQISNNNNLEGQYASTAADSSGRVKWARGSNALFSEEPT